MEEATERPHDHADLYRVTDEAAYLQTGDDEKPAIAAEPMPDLLAPRACSFCKQVAEHLFGEHYPKTDSTGAIIDGVWICSAPRHAVRALPRPRAVDHSVVAGAVSEYGTQVPGRAPACHAQQS